MKSQDNSTIFNPRRPIAICAACAWPIHTGDPLIIELHESKTYHYGCYLTVRSEDESAPVAAIRERFKTGNAGVLFYKGRGETFGVSVP